MIETQDLIRFMRGTDVDYTFGESEEYRAEIIKRLRERDALIKGIEALIARMSNVVDK